MHSCYLSFIFKHSDTIWDYQNIGDQILGAGRAACCAPLNPPPRGGGGGGCAFRGSKVSFVHLVRNKQSDFFVGGAAGDTANLCGQVSLPPPPPP